MDIRHISDQYFVSPQIDPEDMARASAEGFCCVINNRPDAEIPASHQDAVMQAAAEEAGLRYIHLPITHQTMTPDAVAQQAAAIEAAEGKVLAYCASGTRCTVIWSLMQAQSGARGTDDVLAAARAAGYDLENLRPTLDAMATQRG